MIPKDMIGGRFCIERFAGAGGMGTVFRALDTVTGSPVALKLLAASGGAEDRFEREAEVLARLDHPGIVRHVAHGRTDAGAPYLAMEWLEGEDLAGCLARGPIGVPATLTLASRVAEALAYSHRQGVVHRDIKPNNLFLPAGRVDSVLVVDFGIARVLASTRPMTRTGSVLGTLGYMAPEQARGDKSVDARADIFSLGCVLFECIAGRPAFQGQHVIAILAKILLDDPPRLQDVSPDVPAWLATLVRSMLAKEPTARPSDASALAECLSSHGACVAVAAREDRPRQQALSGGEQRLVSVIIVGDSPSANPENASTVSSEEHHAAAEHARELVTPLGGRVEMLADGSLVIMVEGRGSATDQARNAARCALALHRQNPDRPMSLSTGRAVLETRLPVGEAIDRAATLVKEGTSSVTGGGELSGVVLDETTAGLLGATFDVRSRQGTLILCEERPSLDVVRTLLGKPTPCVGREREISLLMGVFEECAAEPGARVVVVSGPAGAGKSRLRHEFMRKLGSAAVGAEVFIGRGEAITASAPFTILAGALRVNASISETESIESKRIKLRARVSRNVPRKDVTRVTELLGDMMGALVAEPDSAELRAARTDPARMQLELRRAWADFLRAEAATNPVLLVIEDLHWAQANTVDVIDAVLDATRDRPLMVLGLARPEVHDLHSGLWATHARTDVALPMLSRRASEKLIREVLGAETAPDTIERLAVLGAGNPLHLEELIRAAAEGRLHTAPGSILAMIQSWIEGFASEERRALRAASVFGEVFWKGGVGQLAGRTGGGDIDPTFVGLVKREVIEPRLPSKFAGELEYAFRHDLVREASYLALTEADQRLGHGLAAEWLQGAGEPNAMVMAEHLARCGDSDRIVAWLTRWDQRAHIDRVAPLLVESADKLLPILDRAGPLAARITGRLRLSSTAASAHIFDVASQYFEEAESLCAGDDALADELHLVRAQLFMRRGDFSSAGEAVNRVTHPERLTGRYPYDLHICHAQVFGAAGREAEALEHLQEASRLSDPKDTGQQVELAKMRGLVAYFNRNFAAAIAAGEQHVRLARAAGLTYELALGAHNLADNLIGVGEMLRARESMAESASIAERFQFLRLLAHDRMYMAFLCAGDPPAQAIEQLATGIAAAESAGYSWDALNGRHLQAKLLVRSNSPDARAALLEVRQRAGKLKNHLIEEEANRMLTEIGEHVGSRRDP
jgi:hypothetical protein